QLRLHPRRVAQPGDAQQLLDAEPQRLAVLEEQRQAGAEADAAVAVEVALVRLEELAAPPGVFVQGQQVVQREGVHGTVLGRKKVISDQSSVVSHQWENSPTDH